MLTPEVRRRLEELIAKWRARANDYHRFSQQSPIVAEIEACADELAAVLALPEAHKPFSELRERMSPESQERAQRRTDEMLAALPEGPAERWRDVKRYSQAELEESLRVVVERTLQDVREGRISVASPPSGWYIHGSDPKEPKKDKL